MWMRLWLSLGGVVGFKVNILKSNVCEMYHSTLNNIIFLKCTNFPVTYLIFECVCNVDISQYGNNFWFLKANNFTKWQHASRTESVVSENYYIINLEQTGVALKCYNQISIEIDTGDLQNPHDMFVSKPATPGYCSFFGMMYILYTHKDSRS